MQQKLFVLDVRTKDELKQGHVEGSLNISFMELLQKLKNNPD
jgi:rhodanese-related sulfurtransferase